LIRFGALGVLIASRNKILENDHIKKINNSIEYLKNIINELEFNPPSINNFPNKSNDLNSSPNINSQNNENEEEIEKILYQSKSSLFYGSFINNNSSDNTCENKNNYLS
jgi:hypothetical protein